MGYSNSSSGNKNEYRILLISFDTDMANEYTPTSYSFLPFLLYLITAVNKGIELAQQQCLPFVDFVL